MDAGDGSSDAEFDAGHGHRSDTEGVSSAADDNNDDNDDDNIEKKSGRVIRLSQWHLRIINYYGDDCISSIELFRRMI